MASTTTRSELKDFDEMCYTPSPYNADSPYDQAISADCVGGIFHASMIWVSGYEVGSVGKYYNFVKDNTPNHHRFENYTRHFVAKGTYLFQFEVRFAYNPNITSTRPNERWALNHLRGGKIIHGWREETLLGYRYGSMTYSQIRRFDEEEELLFGMRDPEGCITSILIAKVDAPSSIEQNFNLQKYTIGDDRDDIRRTVKSYYTGSKSLSEIYPSESFPSTRYPQWYLDDLMPLNIQRGLDIASYSPWGSNTELINVPKADFGYWLFKSSQMAVKSDESEIILANYASTVYEMTVSPFTLGIRPPITDYPNDYNWSMSVNYVRRLGDETPMINTEDPDSDVYRDKYLPTFTPTFKRNNTRLITSLGVINTHWNSGYNGKSFYFNPFNYLETDLGGDPWWRGEISMYEVSLLTPDYDEDRVYRIEYKANVNGRQTTFYSYLDSTRKTMLLPTAGIVDDVFSLTRTDGEDVGRFYLMLTAYP